MKKNILKLFILILLVFPAAAQNLNAQERIIDNASLMTPGQKQNLNNLINSLSAKYRFDLIIVTERSIDGANPMNYADDFFDYNGYGLGQDRDGCLFLQVTSTRDFWFSTSGRGIDMLNSYAYNKLEADVLKHLSAGNNYEAYNAFLQNWEEFLVLDSKGGRRYNFFYQWNILLIIISWALALGIGFIVVMSWKNSMNTAIMQTQASVYVVPGSLSFKEKKDTFLYSNVVKTKKQSENNSGGSGRVRTHTSSSGRSHGGGGGRY